jgi:hypothetical protein
MRLTLLTSAIATMTFVATLAFAPAIAAVGERLGYGQAEVTRASAPVVKVVADRECRSTLHVVVAALGHKECK